MKNNRIEILIKVAILSAVFMLTACGAKTIEDTPEEEDNIRAAVPSEKSKEISTPINKANFVSDSDNVQQQTPALPKPDIELPTLPYDKTKLPAVQKLDEMLMDDAWLETSFNLVYKEIQVLEEKTETSMSGTPEDQIRAIMTMVNGVNHFNRQALPIAKMAMEKFKEKYTDDSDFGDKFYDAYYAAEKEVGEMRDDGTYVIKDNSKRSEVSSHFRNGYMSSRSSELQATTDLIEQSKELTENVINSVISQANTDMMVADYRKGKDIADLMNGTINKLNLVSTLNADHPAIKSARANVEAKRESRLEEINKALVAFQFPERYNAGNAPSNMSSLESKMKAYLNKSKRTSSQNYEVKEIRVASPWIDILHSLTGIHMYSQIDFYVAVPSLEDANILEILYVTGKTGGPHHDSFDSYSVGGIGQMLASNL